MSGELIRRRYVQPVNVKLIPQWRQLAPPFRSPAANTVGGVHYGVTVMWTPNELLYRTDAGGPTPVSWRAVYDTASGARCRYPTTRCRSPMPRST